MYLFQEQADRVYQKKGGECVPNSRPGTVLVRVKGRKNQALKEKSGMQGSNSQAKATLVSVQNGLETLVPGIDFTASKDIEVAILSPRGILGKSANHIYKLSNRVIGTRGGLKSIFDKPLTIQTFNDRPPNFAWSILGAIQPEA